MEPQAKVLGVKALFVAALGLSFAVLSSSAFGTTYVHGFHPDHGSIGLGVVGDDDANAIRIALGSTLGSDYLVTDSEGIQLSFEDECAMDTPRAARCPMLGDVGVGMNAGSDRLRMTGSGYFSRVRGGEGNDVVLGHADRDQVQLDDGADEAEGRSGDDKLSGNAGPDLLSGGQGRDDVVGAAGRDSLRGGPGRDVLDAHDGRADALINCGPGRHDVAYVDRGLDDRVRACERLAFRSRP